MKKISLLLMLVLASGAATAFAEPVDDAVSAGTVVAAPTSSQDDAALLRTERKGLYFGAQMPANIISGDFDIDPSLGFGFTFGYHFDSPIGLEITWARSGHTSGGGTNVTFSELSLNAKVDLRSEGRVIPFLIAGVGSFELGDKSLLLGGSGYNLGIGADASVSAHNTLGLTLMRKIITYDKVLESDPPATLDKDLNGNMVSIIISFTHYF